MRGRTITGLIGALAVGALVLLAVGPPSAPAEDRPKFWPALSQTDRPVKVTEWYSDVPWHQKLGTYAGNDINEAIVLPYEVLSGTDKTYCTDHQLTEAACTPEDLDCKDRKKAACMLEVGVTNVLGTLRTDTLYDDKSSLIQNAPECQDKTLPCIEVKLELSNFSTQSTGAIQPRKFGTEPGLQSDGYTITDGSTYAPQMPWYMAHYCDAFFKDGDAQDPVCYGDYLSPFEDGFNLKPKTAFEEWPSSVPWSVFPYDAPGRNHCKPGETKCTLAMAGFDLHEVPIDLADLDPKPDLYDKKFGPPYKTHNEFLLTWFNKALESFPGDLVNDTRHFPWNGATVTWKDFIQPRAVLNPFLGQFEYVPTTAHGCDITLDSKNSCPTTDEFRASRYVYPRKCDLADLAGAVGATTPDSVKRLRQCGLNYEIHHNGWRSQWPESDWTTLGDEMINSNQYGRTSFLFAGVPGLQLPVSFYKENPADSSGLSVYERVYNASIFSLYMPVANVADTKRALEGRNYKDKEFYHTLLMGNHMEAKPEHFAEGIRGKVLWHNEYRMNRMFDTPTVSPARTFAAAFDPQKATVPFHNNTCDGCHVRNGSGVPINPQRTLDPALQEFMKAAYNPVKDYTFTGQIQPMKLVFFDLKRRTILDGSRYSEPLSPSFPPTIPLVPLRPARPREGAGDDRYYNNKVMNYYGDAFHVTKSSDYDYTWKYVDANPNRVVVKATRSNFETKQTYAPQQVQVGDFRTKSSCDPTRDFVLPSPTSNPWPKTCADINGAAIGDAINKNGEVGFMLLNGKRLGNLSAMEAIPNQAILGFLRDQITTLGPKIAGELVWQAGSRDGVLHGTVKKCASTKKDLTECYIARFGWLGDRVSLEDQVANAAFVEMNMTTSEGAKSLASRDPGKSPIRYGSPKCGPANKTCVESKGNADLSEKDIDRMAEYARWLGNPTRSELKVSLKQVIDGEKIFRQVKCDTCHVIKKIEISDPDDTILSSAYRERLKTRVGSGNVPFLSYIGTDLLMHDMGYLSQVADATGSIRDLDGAVLKGFENYVQKIRTPALKGLRFNRFVTDAHNNTKQPGDPACDFLLHDGRACDAIEAAFLHDGPAIKKLGVIDGPNGLNSLMLQDLQALRAFLYSL